MNIDKFIKGKGVDVSEKHSLLNSKHVYLEPDNYYTLKDLYDYESLDYIYSKNTINQTKFYRILIKEWLNFCKINGNIIIEMIPNKILDFNDLEKEINLLIGDKGKIILKKLEEGKNEAIFIIKKLKKVLVLGDSIDKWSFGIITGGYSDDKVDRGIDSILKLKIPHFEIIVCGTYKGKYLKNKNCRFIYFDTPLAWITKKKNMICEVAKYENLAIIHDRISFRTDWYRGMKKYGNYFEVLSNVTYDPLGRRAQDWMTYGIPLRPFSKHAFTGGGANLEYKDWDKSINIAGLAILKKTVWKKCPWDERLLLWQAEDMKISGDFYEAGFVPRFNPYSTSDTLGKEYGNYNLIYRFNKKKLGRPKSNSFKNLIIYYIKMTLYKKFGVYLKRADNYGEMKRTFLVPMKKRD